MEQALISRDLFFLTFNAEASLDNVSSFFNSTPSRVSSKRERKRQEQKQPKGMGMLSFQKVLSSEKSSSFLYTHYFAARLPKHLQNKLPMIQKLKKGITKIRKGSKWGKNFQRSFRVQMSLCLLGSLSLDQWVELLSDSFSLEIKLRFFLKKLGQMMQKESFLGEVWNFMKNLSFKIEAFVVKWAFFKI